MVNDPVSARYAEALFDLVRREGHIDEAAAELRDLAQLIAEQDALRQFLLNPDVEVADKLAVLERLMGGLWSKTVRSFVQVVLSMDRAAYLAQMAGAFQELVDDEQRVVRVTVRSACALAQDLRARLIQWVEAQERGTVALTEEVDPRLIGGLQVFLDHRTFDGSVRTQLGSLRRRLKRVRVH